MNRIQLFEEYYKNNDYTELWDFIIETGKGNITYLHTTKTKENCESIMNNGLEFYDIHKTTDEISTIDDVEMVYKIKIREYYGNYIVIIQIDRSIPTPKYTELTVKEPFVDEENDEIMYTLPPKFVKGYFNKQTGEIVKNPKFNPK